MEVFTSIPAAIEEARYLRVVTRHHHCVTQKRDGTMRVRQVASMSKERLLRKMYCTQSDKFTRSTIKTEGIL